MEGKAFRHGDIVRRYTFFKRPTLMTPIQEDTLADLIKRIGGGFALASMLSKGSKFGGLDIKRVYFGYFIPRRPKCPIRLTFCPGIGFEITVR